MVTRYSKKIKRLTQFYNPDSDRSNEHGHLSIVVSVIVPISVTWLPSFLVSSSALEIFSALRYIPVFFVRTWCSGRMTGASNEMQSFREKCAFRRARHFDFIDTILSRWTTTAFSICYVAFVCLSNDRGGRREKNETSIRNSLSSKVTRRNGLGE